MLTKIMCFIPFQIINIGPSSNGHADSGTNKPKHNAVPLPATVAQLALTGIMAN